tara:strand:- start:330 stop:539 length:210 start_codon:yes stop_codon:yes gene_type:complete
MDDLEDYMIEVHEEIESVCEEKSMELSTEDMEGIMGHLSANSMDYHGMSTWDCAEHLLIEFQRDRLQFI